MSLFRLILAPLAALFVIGSTELVQAQETTPPTTPPQATTENGDDMDWGWIGLLGLLGLGGLAGRTRDVPTRTTTRT